MPVDGLPRRASGWLALALVAGGALVSQPEAAAASVYVVAPGGSDLAAGTVEAPFGTLNGADERGRAGPPDLRF